MGLKDTVTDLVATVAKLEEVLHRLRVDIPESIRSLRDEIRRVDDASTTGDRTTLEDARTYAREGIERIEANQRELSRQVTSLSERITRIEAVLYAAMRSERALEATPGVVVVEDNGPEPISLPE